MVEMEILESTSGIEGSFVSKYQWDNIGSFDITKDSSIMPFGLPLVNEVTEPVASSMLTEKIDLVAISGISANINISWSLEISKVKIIQDLVNNTASKTHKLHITCWDNKLETSSTNSALITTVNYFGRVGSVSISGISGTPTRVGASMSFSIGSLVDFGEGV